jgi:hypothetical protein
VDDDESSTVLRDVAMDCQDPRPTSTDAHAATGDTVVDPSKRRLSSEIFAILKEAELFSRLDISHNPAVDKATLLQLLREHRLEWVNIDGCSVSNKDMVDLLKSHPSLFRGIEAIIPPAFLSANSLGVSKGTLVAFSLLYKGLFRTRRYVLPFFGVDQIVQNLLDAAAALKSFEYVGSTPMPCNMQSLFAASHRSGRPWATRDIQTIPLQTESRDLAKGYTLIVLPQLYDKLILPAEVSNLNTESVHQAASASSSTLPPSWSIWRGTDGLSPRTKRQWSKSLQLFAEPRARIDFFLAHAKSAVVLGHDNISQSTFMYLV